MQDGVQLTSQSIKWSEGIVNTKPHKCHPARKKENNFAMWRAGPNHRPEARSLHFSGVYGVLIAGSILADADQIYREEFIVKAKGK